MSERKNHYSHEDLSLNQAYSYNLLLQLEANTFSYAITFQKQLLGYGDNYSLEELKYPQQLREILTANYRKVIIGLPTTGFTLLPNGLFDAGRIADVARLLDVSVEEKVNYQGIDDDNVIVYKVDDYILSCIRDFDNTSVNHKAKGWIIATADSRPNDNELYLNIGDETVDFLNFHNRNLRFYNSFGFKNHEELAYFTALVASELQLDPNTTSLVLSGDINESDRGFSYLASFYNKVKLNDIEILTVAKQLSPHKILTLASLTLCV